MKYIFLANILLYTIVFSALCEGQNIAGPDKYILKEESLLIGPDNSDPQLCYYWEPKELLNDNTLPNPTARVSKTTTFKLTVTGKDFGYYVQGLMTVHYIKVENLTGVESYTCQGSDLKLVAKLTDDLALPLNWTVGWGGDGKFSGQNGLSATTTFDRPYENAQIKAWITGSTDTFKLSTLVVGFEIKDPYCPQVHCDGKPMDLVISPLPNGTPKEYLGCFNDFMIFSETLHKSYGNPSGTTQLEFTPVNENYYTTIVNPRWYAALPTYCNSNSDYNIWVYAQTKDGKRAGTNEKIPFRIVVSAGAECVNGSADCCEHFWSGKLGLNPEQDADGKWIVKTTHGTLAKDVIRSPITLEVEPNSQFYNDVKDEEEYHSLQYEGLKPCECCDKGLVVDSILNKMNKYPITGDTKEMAMAYATEYAELCIENEQKRTYELWATQECLCSMEYEAKTYLEAQHEIYNSRWDCTYEECPH